MKKQIYQILSITMICAAITVSINLADALTTSSYTVTSNGQILQPKVVNVSVDFGTKSGISNLAIGVHVAHDYSKVIASPELQSIMTAGNFKLIRFYVSEVQPCKNWNDNTLTGTFDWGNFDTLMTTLQSSNPGADILLAVINNKDSYPPGMVGDFNGTMFPNPTSLAAYCQQIALHLNEKGFSAKYWEPFSEPVEVFSGNKAFNAYVECFNTASDSVLSVLPNVKFGVNQANIKDFLNLFVYVGRNVGFLSFHKYNCPGTQYYNPSGYYNNDRVFVLTNTLNYPVWINNVYHETYTPQQMQGIWQSVNNVTLPVLCTETNFSAIYIGGTDVRIQQVVGAAWYAEQLRVYAINGVSASVYFHFSSGDTGTKTGGAGFGMVQYIAPYQKYYPYLTQQLLGNSLIEGSQLYQSTTSDGTTVQVLSWNNGYAKYVLLIGKSSDAVAINLNLTGLSSADKEAGVSTIDSNAETIQSSHISVLSDKIKLSENGYFVTLLKI